MEKDVLNSYTDEELKEILIDNTIKYYTIIRSEKEAIKILKKYGQQYFDKNKTFKSYYLDFNKAVKKRNIILSKEIENVEISDEDILERIMESEDGHIALISRHANDYCGYLGNGEFEKDKNTSNVNAGVSIRLKEIEKLYEEIVNSFEKEEARKK